MSEIDLSKEKVLFRCYHADELTAYETVYKHILGIINKAKDGE